MNKRVHYKHNKLLPTKILTELRKYQFLQHRTQMQETTQLTQNKLKRTRRFCKKYPKMFLRRNSASLFSLSWINVLYSLRVVLTFWSCSSVDVVLCQKANGWGWLIRLISVPLSFRSSILYKWSFHSSRAISSASMLKEIFRNEFFCNKRTNQERGKVLK